MYKIILILLIQFIFTQEPNIHVYGTKYKWYNAYTFLNITNGYVRVYLVNPTEGFITNGWVYLPALLPSDGGPWYGDEDHQAFELWENHRPIFLREKPTKDSKMIMCLKIGNTFAIMDTSKFPKRSY